MNFLEAVNGRASLIAKIGLDNTYLAMAVALFLEEPDVDALASAGMTDGSGDKKIDFIYHDVNTKKLVFAQGYLSKKTKDEAPANKASDLNTACAWLLSGDLSLVPEKLRGVISSARSSLDSGDIESVDLMYVHNLPESVNVSRELQTAEGNLRKLLQGKDITIRAHELGRPKLDSLLAAQDSYIEVTDDINFPGTIALRAEGEKWKAGVATVQATWLHGLYEKYGDKLYSANYRGFLGVDGRRKINHGIRETAEKQPGDFWAFNNGITVLTLALAEKKGSKVLQGISIINGAQTSGTLGSVDAGKVDLSKVAVLCRVIECTDQNTIEDIVRYNNTQNAITTWDRFSNDADQRRLSEEFSELGYSYNRKRGFSVKGDVVGIEQVLQPLLAFHGRPTDAVRGKAQLFEQVPAYRNAFEGKKARHVLFVYSLARAVDEKRTALKKKSDEGILIAIEQKQLALLRNLNFKPLFLALVGRVLETLVGRPCDPMTVGFKASEINGTVISELAARWAGVVDGLLPLVATQLSPELFFRELTAKGDGGVEYLSGLKDRSDGLIVASGLPEKLQDFAARVSGG